MEVNQNEDAIIYKVVVNLQGQYSIWPLQRNNPPGWKTVDKSGTEEECMAFIEFTWTHMEPLKVKLESELD